MKTGVEPYRYDSDVDYLTGSIYNDGLLSEVQTWSYDAAANRSNSGYTYDNLNRMTASPGSTTYENDILGNRTYRNPLSSTTVRYVWDDAGRMTKVAGVADGATNSYRADGMRMKKVTGLTLSYIMEEESASGFYDEFQATNYPTWRYRYDGQMCYEEDYTVGTTNPTITGTAYGLGARGLDMLRPFTVSSGSRSYASNSEQFPIYDGHGNMKCTLTRSGSSPHYTIANSRSYDVWGGLRPGSGNETGNPNTRYCANLGHKQDDESGLIYMRARYYEPGTGRFISEDPARDGANWFVYCNNDPISRIDKSGNYNQRELLGAIIVWVGLTVMLCALMGPPGVTAADLAATYLLFSMGISHTWNAFWTMRRNDAGVSEAVKAAYKRAVERIEETGLAKPVTSVLSRVLLAYMGYGLYLLGAGIFLEVF